MRRLRWMVLGVVLMGDGVCGFGAAAAGPGAGVTTASAPAGTVRNGGYPGPVTFEEVGRLKAALAVPGTRMGAIKSLLEMAGPSAYPMSSMGIGYADESGPVRQAAAEAVGAAADEGTILAALASTDMRLGYWGVSQFSRLKEKGAGVVLLKRMAQGKDVTLRREAVGMLNEVGEREFVKELAGAEKSAWVLEGMGVWRGEVGEGSFPARLAGLVNDADAEARRDALQFVGGNWISAASRQIVIDAGIMDALLTRAQSADADAGEALAVFVRYSNAEKLVDAAGAAAWWKEHRTAWAYARIPRWSQPNGPQIFSSIVTTGVMGGTPAWGATVTLENKMNREAWVNVAEVTGMRWTLFNAAGERVASGGGPTGPVEWVLMKPGEVVRRGVAIGVKAGEMRGEGPYVLRASVGLGVDLRDPPAGLVVTSGELVLPGVMVEVRGE